MVVSCVVYSVLINKKSATSLSPKMKKSNSKNTERKTSTSSSGYGTGSGGSNQNSMNTTGNESTMPPPPIPEETGGVVEGYTDASMHTSVVRLTAPVIEEDDSLADLADRRWVTSDTTVSDCSSSETYPSGTQITDGSVFDGVDTTPIIMNDGLEQEPGIPMLVMSGGKGKESILVYVKHLKF